MNYSVLFSLLILASSSICAANISIYLLGDSVYAHLYSEGLMDVLNCRNVDPLITFSAETTATYSMDKGHVCTGSKLVNRIGYTIHFGVFESNYHANWKSHQPYGATENSRTNIKMAVTEFQNRTRESTDEVLFMFLSSLWDVKRYNEHNNLYRSEEDWLDAFQDRYTSLMLELREMMRPRDKLVISTMHGVLDVKTADMNLRAKRVARHLRIPVFDQANLLGTNMQEYLLDRTHQNVLYSHLITENILKGNWSIIPECPLP